MYVCVLYPLGIHAFVYVRMCLDDLFMYGCMRLYACMHLVLIYVYVPVCMHACIHLICACLCNFVRACMHVCVCICNHTHPRFLNALVCVYDIETCLGR